MSTTMEHWERVAENSNACDEHKLPFDFKADVAEVIAAFEGCMCAWGGNPPCNSYCDSDGVAVVLLKDGRFAVCREGSDTSGHG